MTPHEQFLSRRQRYQPIALPPDVTEEDLVPPAGITQRVPLAVMSRTWPAIWFSCMSTEWVWDAD